MPRDPSPAQRSASQQNGKRSQGRPSAGARPESSLDAEMDDLRARTVALAHDEGLCAERCKLWHDDYQPQSLITQHLTTECARSSLLADQVAEFRQAELEEQARVEEHRWTRRQRRRARYLGIKIKTRPAEAVEQLLAFGEGVELLVDNFLRLVDEARNVGYLTPPMAVRALAVCGCTQEPASIGCNPLAYTLLINNLGCTPAVPAADIDPWLEPVRRPAALRDQPRHALMGADPEECRMRLLTALEAESQRLMALACRVREETDMPSLCQALNRVCILTEKSARRAASNHTEARVTFRQASKDLVKALERDRKNADRQEDGFFSPKPEKGIDAIIRNPDETTTYVEARVSGSGCANSAKPGQTEPPPAQTGAETTLTTLHDPRPTTRWPAVIAKYQKEFDAELRPYDHLR